MTSRFCFLHLTRPQSCPKNFSSSRIWFQAHRLSRHSIRFEVRLTICQAWMDHRGRQNVGSRVLRCVDLIFVPVLLVVIGLDDIAYDGARCRSSMLAAALDECDNHNLRIASRCVAYEPPIGFFPFLPHAASRLVAHSLGGP